MSCYSQIVVDLPLRCQKLLGTLLGEAETIGCEVTFLLSLAETSIVIPYERLKEPRRADPMKCPHCHKELGLCPKCRKELTFRPQSHPSGDRERLPEASKEMDSLKNALFIGSVLWPRKDAGSWRCATVKTPDDLDHVEEKELTGDKRAWTVLKTIRHALAHANIFTRGDRAIEKIVFLSSRGVREWECLSVTPEDFKTFLCNWLNFVTNVRIPGGLTPDDGD
ncbi:MAG: hypothetical protein ABSF26_03225 [Thermoguttaceae bacterium]|jgi:hypothetical protein